MSEEIRVLVVDACPASGNRLAGLRDDGVEILGPVWDASAALTTLDAQDVSLVLVDLDRLDGSGIETVRAIREGATRPRVLGITEHQGPDLAAGALAAGACGVVSSEPNGEPLLASFRRALAGELVLPAIHLTNLVDRLRVGRDATAAGRLDFLTGREREILGLLADGSSTVEIARTLGIRPMTVQSHVKNILAKLGVHSKVEAVTLAWRLGLGTATRTA
jgi:two-component system nitrate/nitrite response regulator NarL